MDIFMPGMGGQEATQIIRSLPEPACLTPVIALTANACSEDEAIFRAAGMDGMLSKPVSPSELVKAIETYVWSAPSAGRPLTIKKASFELAKPSPSLPVLSSARLDELRDNLPPEKFAGLLEECLVDINHRLPALRRALSAGVPEAITVHAHAMVGMAAGYGMAALEVRLRVILNAARKGNTTPYSPSVLQELDREFVETARQVREMLRREVV
jgi:CheY-like chemotaxis protein